MYLKWEDGLMLVSNTEKEGYKPAVYTEAPEAPTGYTAGFYWRETEDAFVQTWEVVPEMDEVTPEEALNILLGGEA